MTCLVEFDGPSYSFPLQIVVQGSERLFRVIPTPTLIDGYVDILWSKVFHQVEYGQIPIASKDRSVVPMDAGDEDLLTANVGGVGGQILVLTSGNQGQYIDYAKENEKEEGRPKDSGPRGSGEAAELGPYHGRSEKWKQPRPQREEGTTKFHKQLIMIILE